MSEKNILCNCIENYIEIANKNNTTLDDYISIIALIKIFQKQYKEYYADFNKYIDMFSKKGILGEYYKSTSNITKKHFSKYGTNPSIAYKYLYAFIDGCSNRFMHYLIIIGLTGKPKTKLQYHILATAYNYNTITFYKQRVYYTELYLKRGMYRTGNEVHSIKMQKAIFIDYLGFAYEKDKKYDKALICYKKANKNINNYRHIVDFYIKNKQYKQALVFLEKNLKSNRINEHYYCEKQKLINSFY